jgi:imidazolonepropionase-like amidohydrolase
MMSESEWIRASAVVIGDGHAPLADHAVRIEGDVITDVIPGSKAPSAALDLGGRTLIPGLIDAHVHLTFSAEPNHDAARRAVEVATPVRLLATAARHGLDCLRGGVTTVRDLGDRDLVVAELRDFVAEGLLLGPTILSAGTPITITAGHLGWLGGGADGPDAIVATTRRLVASGVDVIKVMATGGNMTRESNNKIPQFTAEELRLIVFEAHRGRKKVAAHAHNAEALRRCISAGVDTLEHCGWRDADGNPDLTGADLTAMKAAATVGVATLAGIARYLLPDLAQIDPEAARIAVEASPSGGDLRADFAWARTMRDAGIDVVLASDAGVRFTPFERFIDTLRAGAAALDIDAATAIGLATGTAARALGIDSRTGTIEAGKRADLAALDRVVTDGDARLGNVDDVWRGGRHVVQNGRVQW